MTVVTNNTIQPSSGQALTIKDEGGTASITVATNGEATFAENIKITSSKGIDFSANSHASGMTGELLSDYEEGTFDAIFNGIATDGAGSYDIHQGYYCQVGNLITVSYQIKYNGANTNIGSSHVYMTLPKTSINVTNYQVSSTNFLYMLSGSTQVSCLGLIGSNTTSMFFYRVASATTDLTGTALIGNSAHSGNEQIQIGGTVTYRCQ